MSGADTTLRGVLHRVIDGSETTFSDADELVELLNAPGTGFETERSVTSRSAGVTTRRRRRVDVVAFTRHSTNERSRPV